MQQVNNLVFSATHFDMPRGAFISLFVVTKAILENCFLIMRFDYAKNRKLGKFKILNRMLQSLYWQL